MKTFTSIESSATHLRHLLSSKDYLLLFAYNGTGKTRLSMAFKEIGKNESQALLATEEGNILTTEDGHFLATERAPDTLYFNAFTEDLFQWDTPFAYHVSVLAELQLAQETGNIKAYHFGMLRAVLEKTSVFFGCKPFTDCLGDDEDKAVLARFLNLYSHGKSSIYEYREPNEQHKDVFVRILERFLEQYEFNLPSLNQPQRL